MQRLATDGPR
ncbi:hypothetical protein LINPERHAP1_LOCUS38207 [Linum perenne]